MDIRIVVSEQLLLFLGGEGPNWSFDVAAGIFAADHEPNLTGGVCGDGCVGIFDGREDLLAVLLELGDQWEVEPLVFSWKSCQLLPLQSGVMHKPCVVITPPSLRAPKSNSKYGFWNKLSAGPSGSEESVIMTSNSFL